ncbi:hypothetical protein OPT61_g10674 [Boeremia exigua]|uniref:Uncharacterized protein n=1 Tax=Boeremia exigua TaxID=749465 RepID=A0ACC2HNW3_9PLEO|nr:hypothetical protein OPT61_g10674 [Boeremia exigua]
MAASVARFAASLFLVPLVLASAPIPSVQDSDLTILTHNDLYGSGSSRQASAILISKPQSQSAAASSCAALGESLWSTSKDSPDQGFLQYLGYDSETHDRNLYWAASTAPARCNAISAQGRTQQLPCNTLLPALCRNSAALSSPASTDTSTKWQTSVSTGNATVTGYRDKHSFRFQGIKYATIPSRFSDSVYLAPAGSISATSYGPQCIQLSFATGAAEGSEDCLYLNIWTPTLPSAKSSKTKKKAVMVWIHGGGFVSGSGSDTTFDGGAIASRGDVVLVTINYRLGNLGFLAIENTPLTGNYGLKDQSRALDWLAAHIGAFGGDKDKMTVFGQSAGASSAQALLASTEARGKFARFIRLGRSSPRPAVHPATATPSSAA